MRFIKLVHSFRPLLRWAHSPSFIAQLKYARPVSHTFFAILFLLSPSLGFGQEKEGFVKRMYNTYFASSNDDTTRSSTFFVLPAMGYAQETGLEIGLASSYNFYTDPQNPLSRTSVATLMGTITTENQKNIKLNTDIWTKNNDYRILSEIRYRDWPYNFYGIGNQTWWDDEDYIGQKLFRTRVEVERKISNAIYVGLNVNYEHFRFTNFEPGGIFENEVFDGKAGGQHLILGGSLLYDTRNNTTFTTTGWYGRVKYGYAPQLFGQADFVGSQIDVDLRKFHSLNSRVSVAVQGIFRGSYGENVPFYVFRDLGGDMTMRGYYLGRYRDRNYLATQAEARYRFHSRLGVTAFVGTGSTFSNEQTIRLIPSYGMGLRYFFNLEHSTTVRFDYAIGEKRPGEKRQQGFYISLSEAF